MPSPVQSAFQIALDKAELLEPIPRITHPWGKSWEQPDRSEILLDDEYAVMSKATFDKLHEYSASNPSGVYEGKMWKRNDGAFDIDFLAKGGKPTWYLVWYGRHPDPDKVSNNYRKILIIT